MYKVLLDLSPFSHSEPIRVIIITVIMTSSYKKFLIFTIYQKLVNIVKACPIPKLFYQDVNSY